MSARGRKRTKRFLRDRKAGNCIKKEIVNMANRVITIAREYGSGGRSIGKMLARELGFAFYDDEILRMASDESGIKLDLFGEMDEYIPAFARLRSVRDDACLGETFPPSSDEYTSIENRFRFTAKIMRRLAQTENCVIVGRAANYILSDMRNCVHIYVHAPMDYCVRKTMEVDALSMEEAERKVNRIDRQRGAYFKHFTDRNWKDADLYDLCINSSLMSWEKSVQVVKSYLDVRFSEQG